MDTKSLVAAIDEEIKKLQEVRRVLSGTAAPTPKAPSATKANRPKRRKLSAEGRARIAEAQRKRWAEKKGTGKKNSKAAA
jgi:hypothetical protein